MKNKNINAAQYFKNGIKLTVLAISLVSFSFIFPTKAQASTLSLGTAPTSLKLELTQGQKYNGEIVVWNLSDTTTTYDIIVSGFRQIENQPGTAIMLTEEEEKKMLYSATSWVTVDKKQIELVPNRNEKIFYEINVPNEATKGEYNVRISFISQKATKTLAGTAAITSLSAGTPILIKVGKDFVENAELLRFDTDKNFYEIPNVQFETSIKNLGDTHITPVGEIVLTNMFEQEVARITFNPNTQSILRENTANYQSTWDFGKYITKDNAFVLGPIKAKLIVTYRSFQPGFSPLTAETSFWVIPWKYIVGIIIIIITIVTVIKVRKNKKKNLPYNPLPR